jgi:hypothetical protein
MDTEFALVGMHRHTLSPQLLEQGPKTKQSSLTIILSNKIIHFLSILKKLLFVSKVGREKAYYAGVGNPGKRM